jgi:hypothetical protein
MLVFLVAPFRAARAGQNGHAWTLVRAPNADNAEAVALLASIGLVAADDGSYRVPGETDDGYPTTRIADEVSTSCERIRTTNPVIRAYRERTRADKCAIDFLQHYLFESKLHYANEASVGQYEFALPPIDAKSVPGVARTLAMLCIAADESAENTFIIPAPGASFPTDLLILEIEEARDAGYGGACAVPLTALPAIGAVQSSAKGLFGGPRARVREARKANSVLWD